jgi:hypothetical protein
MVPPKAGAFGTMGRNIFRDSGFKNVDFSVFKNFAFKERYNAQFRVEFFNIFNHPIIANPFGSVNNYGGGSDPGTAPTTFGCGCSTPDIAAGNPIRRFGKQPRHPTRVQVHVLIAPASSGGLLSRRMSVYNARLNVDRACCTTNRIPLPT